MELQEFSFDRLKENPVIYILGRRRTGKSTLMSNLLNHYKDIPLVYVASGSEGLNPFYQQYIPSCFVHSHYSDDKVRTIIESQKRNPGRKALVVIDDCSHQNMRNTDALKYLFFNGRHINITLMIAQHWFSGIQPAERAQIDYCFFTRETQRKSIREIHNNYSRTELGLEDFRKIMDEKTVNYTTLVMDNTATGHAITDQLLTYRAKLSPEFWMCDDFFWKRSTNYPKYAKIKKHGESRESH